VIFRSFLGENAYPYSIFLMADSYNCLFPVISALIKPVNKPLVHFPASFLTNGIKFAYIYDKK